MKKFSIERPDFLNLDFDTKKTGRINESLNLSKFEKEAEKDSDLFTEFEVEAKSLNEEMEEADLTECGGAPIDECGGKPITEGSTKHIWEVQYLDGTIDKFTNPEKVQELVDSLERFERDDVNRIDLVDENGEFIDDVWTVEEGIMNDESLYEGCDNKSLTPAQISRWPNEPITPNPNSDDDPKEVITAKDGKLVRTKVSRDKNGNLVATEGCDNAKTTGLKEDFITGLPGISACLRSIKSEIYMQNQEKEPNEEITLGVYIDQSGSAYEQSPKLKELYATLTSLQQKGLLTKLDFWYFADTITDKGGAAKYGSRGFLQIPNHIYANGYTNVIIVTDDDADYLADSALTKLSDVTVSGAVWWLWYSTFKNGAYAVATKAKKFIKGTTITGADYGLDTSATKNKPALTEDTWLSQEEFGQLKNDPLTKELESIIAGFFADEGVKIPDPYINGISAKLAHTIKTYVADYKKVKAHIAKGKTYNMHSAM